MRANILCACIAVLLVTAGSSTAIGNEGSANKPYMDLSGFYAFNGYSQNNFFLGAKQGAAGALSDKDEYAIQLVRLTGKFGWGENIKAVVRADVAQGIWGIDNFERDADSSEGFSNIFNRKDTNFSIHIDWAYVDFTHPDWKTNFKLGRMKFALGNLLVLDQDSDGFQVKKTLGRGAFKLGWAIISEGADSLSDEDGIGPQGMSTEDAWLALAQWSGKCDCGWEYEPFLVYYEDAGIDDMTAYLPQGLQYFKPRFQPQVTEAVALGVPFKGKAGKWEIKGEVDYLTGDDEISNLDSSGSQLLDVNNGDLEGYNIYVDAKVPAGPGKFGLVFGMGSGDDDPMSGDGNINKIRTNGFFYVTEVWEDSIMPDEEGITPQGLGSPGSRGYRELENTTLLQANYNWNISDKWSCFISGTHLIATEDLHPWSDVDISGTIDPGEFGPESEDDLGDELDMRLSWKVYPGLLWVLRGGVFWPGDAAGFLINGTQAFDDTAWELRSTVKFTFGGIRVGG